MGLVYHLEDYARYREVVGAATCIDVTRRTDPARIPLVWERLADIVTAYGSPWATQIWTKDPQGVLQLGQNVVERLLAEGTTITAQVTVTGLAGTVWEPCVPQDVSGGLDELATLLGGYEHICWRYDPIIPTVHSLDVFVPLAKHMASLGIRRGVLNFIAPPGRYARVDRRMMQVLPSWAAMNGDYADLQLGIAREIVNAACDLGIEMGCCAESNALSSQIPGLRVAACTDYDWFSRLAQTHPPRKAYQGSRKGCGCLRYFDVGSYGLRNQCFGCLYCYAG